MISQKLRDLKEASGMTSHELSAATDIPESTLSRILTGACDSPSFDNVARIVRAMGGSLDDIADIPRPDPPPAAPSCPTANTLASMNAYVHDLSEKISALDTAQRQTQAFVRVKDCWVTRMFVYCCFITTLLVTVLLLYAF